jgi:hypothetical protein
MAKQLRAKTTDFKVVWLYDSRGEVWNFYVLEFIDGCLKNKRVLVNGIVIWCQIFYRQHRLSPKKM